MRILLFALAFLLSACSTASFAGEGTSHHAGHDEPRPFMADRDAHADVDAALARARKHGTLALIVMGGNWCHDSRGFAAALERPETAALVADKYELVWVDVGRKVLNQDVAHRFGLDGTPGTPTVVIARGDGTVLNRDTAPTWRNAASRSHGDIHAELASFVE